MDRLVVVFDEHFPETIPAYYDVKNPSKQTAFEKFIADFKPTIFGRGGDSLDLACVSHWNKGKARVIEGKRLGNDYAEYRKLLKKQDAILDKTVKQKFFLTGNHERWLEDLMDENPQAYEGIIGLEENLQLKDRGYALVGHRLVHTVGKMNFIHGDFKRGYMPAYHAKAIAQIYHRNIFYGHFHTEQSYIDVSPVDTHACQAQSVGTMANVNPAWRRNEPTMWVNSFLVAYIMPDGNFTPYVVRVVEGRFVFDGILYK